MSLIPYPPVAHIDSDYDRRNMARPRIVVADDYDKTRAAIASLLASDFDVVSTVADGQAAVEAAGAL